MSKQRYYPSTPTTETKSLTAPTSKNGGKHGKRPPIALETTSQDYKVDYMHLHETLYRKEISDWQTARAYRYDPFNPSTFAIQQLYKDSMLDLHLFAAIRARVLAVSNKRFMFIDADGNADNDLSKVLAKKWFKTIVKEAVRSKFYGYSTLYIKEAEYGRIKQVELIKRECVIPEYRIILKNPLMPRGEHIAIEEFPTFIMHIELGDNAIGDLERIAPMTVFKRHSWASWDEFEQIFGVPIRIAKTIIDTKKHRDELQMWLETMGSASYGIFDKRVDLEVKENRQQDAYNVFEKKILRVNSEISKGVVGQTMTMDEGASRAQGQVHQNSFAQINDDDIADVEEWIGEFLLPLMRSWGYAIPDGHTVQALSNASTDASEKIKVDGILLDNGYNLDQEYIESTYEVKLDAANPRTTIEPYVPQDVSIKPNNKKKNNLAFFL